MLKDVGRRWQLKYGLVLVEGDTNRITGQFIIIMCAGASGLWSISNWTDIATNPEYSWTELKAEFIRGGVRERRKKKEERRRKEEGRGKRKRKRKGKGNRKRDRS